jgi:serine/threonine protein phosphatase PrpC
VRLQYGVIVPSRMASEQTPGLNKSATTERAKLRVCHAVITDSGCEREVNEDRFLAVKTPVGDAFFVFDGIAGEAGGAAAAQVSADIIEAYLSQAQPGDLQELIRGAVLHAHRKLVELRKTGDTPGMGTTVVGALVRGAEVVVASVGDSRAYRISAEGIQQITSDHTLVQELVDAGVIAPEDALVHPQSHILSRCLGTEGQFEADVFRLWAWPSDSEHMQDSIVLCTDGLYSLVSNYELCDVVRQSSPDAAVQQLVSMARHRGGFDNITALIVSFSGVLKAEQPLLSAPTEVIETQSFILPEVDVTSMFESQINAGESSRQASWLRRLLLGGSVGAPNGKTSVHMTSKGPSVSSRSEGREKAREPERSGDSSGEALRYLVFLFGLAACAAVLTFSVLTFLIGRG